jgi:hypothetical protein
MSGETARTLGRPALATACIAGLELAWLYPLLHLASRGMNLDVSAPSLLLIYAASVTLTVGLRTGGRSPRLTRVISWLAWPVATAVLFVALLYARGGLADGAWATAIPRAFDGTLRGVEAVVFIVFAAGVLWWLGTRLGVRRVAYANVLTEFQLGLLVLAGSLLVGYLAGVDQPAAVPLAVVFVGFGLVAAAATRTDDESGPLLSRRGGTWWRMLLISVTVVLILGLVAGIVFTPGLMHLVARGLHAVWDLIDRLLSAIAGLFSSSGPEAQPAPGPQVAPLSTDEPGVSLSLPDSWLRPSRIIYGIFIAIVALTAVLALALQLFSWIRRTVGEGGVQVERVPGGLRLDLARLFRRIVAWAGRFLPFLRLRRRPALEPAQTTSVRRLYAEMLRWGAEAGLPRRSAQTPLEYLETLCMALPLHRADVTLITESYVRARYGAQPPTDAELVRLRESRRRLKRKSVGDHDTHR